MGRHKKIQETDLPIEGTEIPQEPQISPKVKDFRKNPDSAPLGAIPAFIPEGITNEVMDIIHRKDDGTEISLGSLEIGTDGFFQMVLMTHGVIFHLKRNTDEKVSRLTLVNYGHPGAPEKPAIPQ